MKKDETNNNLTDLEWLYDDLEHRDVMFFNYAKTNRSAAILHNRYGFAMFVNEHLVNSSAEEKYAIAHEYAHMITGTLHRVGDSPAKIARDEYIADFCVAINLVPPEDIKRAVRDGNRTIWELAEYFNFPPRFIQRVISMYRCKGLL